MHGINVKIYDIHDTNILPMTVHMITEKEHQSVHTYLDTLNDISQ